ncbi:MAG: thioredoxin domain-containing protein, partial [Deltaproteobacteria bacterium]|nr:thioredoxin domain-containing protein [Deltaproteobacteria bacterium]
AAISEGACQSAHASGFSEINGIPISIYGAIFYLFIGLFAVFHSALTKIFFRNLLRIMFLMSTASVLYSLFLAAVLISGNGFCPMCAGMYACNIAIFIPLLVEVRRSGGIFSCPSSRREALREFVVIAAAFLAVLFASSHIYKSNAKNAKAVPQKQQTMQKGECIKITSQTPLKGEETAKIKIVEVSDLECPYCSTLFFTLEEIYKKYSADVSIAFYHFPLDTCCNPYIKACMHKTACQSAYGAICAQEQGKFWEYTALLYDFIDAHSKDELFRYAEEIGLDMEKFRECYNGSDTLKKLMDDIEYANLLGVRATPTFFINNLKFEGAMRFEDIEKMLLEALKQ